MSWVGSDRVNKFSILVGRLGSGQEVFKSNGSGRVGSRGVQNVTGRGKSWRVTRETRVSRGSGHHDPRVVFG